MNTPLDLLCYSLLSNLLSQPERIQGDEYSIRSELWSLGVSLLEVKKISKVFYLELSFFIKQIKLDCDKSLSFISTTDGFGKVSLPNGKWLICSGWFDKIYVV